MKRLEFSVYHSVLRVALCVCACLVAFDSGLLNESTKALSTGAQNYIASAVGVRVGVAENDVNILTKRITELESELAQKERDIAVRLNTDSNSPSFDTSTFVLSLILFILLVLIVLNYILDYVRLRQATLVRKTAL